MKQRISILLLVLLIVFTVNSYVTAQEWHSDITFGLGTTYDQLRIKDKTAIETSLFDTYWDEYSFSFVPQDQDRNNNLTAEVLVPMVNGPFEVGIRGNISQKMKQVGPFVGYKTDEFNFLVSYNQVTYDYNTTATDKVKAAWEDDPGLYINNHFYKPGTEVTADITGEIKTRGLSLRGAYQLSDDFELMASWTRTKQTTMTPQVKYKINNDDLTNHLQQKEEVPAIEVDSSELIQLGIAYDF